MYMYVCMYKCVCVCVCVCHIVCVCVSACLCANKISRWWRKAAPSFGEQTSNDTQIESFMRALKAACTSSLRPHTLVAAAGSLGRTT